MWSKLLNYDSNERRNSVFYPHKKFGGKTCLSLNYDATQLYIFLVPLNFIQDESEKRTDIFRFKTVFSNTYNTYKVVRIIKYTCKNTMEKNNSKNQYIFQIVRRFEKMIIIRTAVVVRNFTHPVDVVIDEMDVILTRSLFMLCF